MTPVDVPANFCSRATGLFRNLPPPMKLVTQVFFTKVADYVLKFATSVLIARYLGPTDKGVLTFALLVVGWAATFGNFSLADANVYLVGKRALSSGQALSAALWFSIVAGSVYVLGLFSLVHLGLVRWTVGEPRLFYLLLLLIPLNLLLANFTAILQGLTAFKAYNVSTVFRSATVLVAILLVIRLAEQRLQGVAYATVAVSALNALFLLGYLVRIAGWKHQLSIRYLMDAVHYGLRNHLSVILAAITFRLDQFVLGATLNPIHLGWYSIAVSISELPQLLPDAIGVVLLPRVAGDRLTGASLTARACRLTVLVMMVACGALAVVAPFAIPFIFGEAFSKAVNPLLFLLPSIVFFSMTKILTKYICGVGRPALGVWSTAASATVTAIMIFPMIRRFGAVGAAITSSCAYGVGALVDLGITAKLSTIPLRDFLLLRKNDLQALRPIR